VERWKSGMAGQEEEEKRNRGIEERGRVERGRLQEE
jgi:hypothetical protein